MKKIVFLLIAVLMVGMFSGCVSESGTGSEEDRKPESNDAPRTVDISKGITDDGKSFSYSLDFDFDGENEDIEIDVLGSDNASWDNDMQVSVGEYSVKTDVDGASIRAVYACDIDINDNVRDLVIITNEMSDDPFVRIYKYDEYLPLYEFSIYEPWSGKETVYDYNSIGYAVNLYFNVNEDDTITIEEQTPSMGMWSVYKTYYRDGYGCFKEDKPEYYEILPDFMTDNYYYNNEMTGEEKEMWADGYIKAYTDYTSGDFTINEGEYFKVLCDDGDDNIYVEKEDGTSAWIVIDYEMYSLNQYFFHLAG